MAAVALVGIIASLALFVVFRSSEKARFAHHFETLVDSRVTALDHTVQRYTEFLQGYRLLFTLRHELGYTEFSEATQSAQKQYPALSTVEWAPLVAPGEFNQVKEKARAQGLPPLILKSWVSPGNLIEVDSPATEVQPVLYISPRENPDTAYGFDILSGINRPEIEHSRATQQPRMSRIAPRLGSAPVLGFALYMPVFANQVGEENYRGALIGIFELEEFLTETAADNGGGDIDILLEDVTPRGAEGTLALLKADGTFISAAQMTSDVLPSSLQRTVNYSPWQRTWRLTLSPTQAWIAQNTSHASWFVLLFSLSLTMGICGILAQKDRNLSETEGQVKQSKFESESSQLELQAVIDHSPNPIFLKGLDGRYIAANNGVTKINRSAHTRYVGLTDDELFTPERAQQYRETDAKIISTNTPHSYEAIREVGSESRRLLISKYPIKGPTGDLIAIGGISVDITERTKREAQERATERQLMESHRLQCLNSMAGGFAHDFNNLLAIVLANTGVLSEHMRDSASATDRKFLQDIDDAVERASVLSRRMLAFTGLLNLRPKAIDASEFISENMGILRLSISRHQQPRLELGDGLPPLYSDETLLLEVLNCLITNATEAIAEQGNTIVIKTRLTEVTAEMLAQAVPKPQLEPGKYIEITVTDNGVGVDSTEIGRIFDPFYSTKIKGRGLGLSATMGIIKRSKGALIVESQLGIGSSFRTLWPVAPVESYPPSIPSSSIQPEEPIEELHALVVDDEKNVRFILAKVIGNMGVTVTVAFDGLNGLELMKAAARPFDFVVTDLTMPNLDGDEMLEEMRVTRPHLPAIIVSGYALTDTKKRFKDHPHTLFLAKPFRVEKLRESIDQIRAVLRKQT
jgi:PAS domain S-box-containing protein